MLLEMADTLTVSAWRCRKTVRCVGVDTHAFGGAETCIVGLRNSSEKRRNNWICRRQKLSRSEVQRLALRNEDSAVKGS